MSLYHEVRYGIRRLTKDPKFTITAVLTLALGIGATTAVFSLVHGVLLRPLSYSEPERLVWLHECLPALAEKFPVLPVNARHFLQWRQASSSFTSLSLLHRRAMNLTGRGEPERLDTVGASVNLFKTLGVQPALGRAFLPEEDGEGRPRVVVLSDRCWRNKFSADPSILGATVTLDHDVYTIVGVLPADFRLPSPNPWGAPGSAIRSQPDLYTPKVFTAAEKKELMSLFNFDVLGRLKTGVTREQTAAELHAITTGLVKTAGEDLELRVVVKPLKEAMVEGSRRALLMLLGAVGAGLLIACLNLASLSLVRAERHSFDAALRTALGASRTHLLRQVLAETGLVAVLGAALGVTSAVAGLRLLVYVAPTDIPRLNEVRIDGSVLLFALGVTVATMLLLGLLPAWRTAQSRPEHVLRAAGRPVATAAGLRIRSALVSIEVGLGVVLLVIAGLLLNSFSHVIRADKGFHAPTVLAVGIAPSPGTYNAPEQKRRFHARLLEEVASAPGVRSAALVSTLPLTGQDWISPVWLAGDSRRDLPPMANVRFVSAGYFDTMGIPLVEGRTFAETDRERGVAVVSQRLARVLWPQDDWVVGRRFLHESGKEYEVIGVAANVRTYVDRETAPALYRPYWDGAPEQTIVVARSLGDPFSIAGAVRAAIRNADPEVPIAALRTMREVLDDAVSQRRFQMLVASLFAISALLLAALGIYGVVSYSVARQTRDIGIRAALGARPVDLCGMVLLRGMAPVGLGLLAGVVGALVIGQLLRSLLYEISSHDPLTILAVSVVVVTAAGAACWLPARRAARIDPMVALRYE